MINLMLSIELLIQSWMKEDNLSKELKLAAKAAKDAGKLLLRTKSINW